MKTFKLTSAFNLEQTEVQLELNKPNYCKVRITSVGISQNDIELFNGKAALNYPITPGRQAVGIVSEIGDNDALKRGDRVVISPYFSCNNCLECRNDNIELCKHPQIAGINADGFLSDFVIVSISNCYKLPENVADEKAIFIPYIATAISVLNDIGCEVGNYIGIGSSGVLGTILAQLVLYRQAIPIVVDNRKKYLQSSKDNGVYYAFDDSINLERNMKQVTSGKMADKMIYISKSSLDFKDCFKCVKFGGTIPILSIATFNNYDAHINVTDILEKNTTIIPFMPRQLNFESAINMLVNDQINVEPLISGEADFDNVENLLNDLSNDTSGKPIYQYIVKI